MASFLINRYYLELCVCFLIPCKPVELLLFLKEEKDKEMVVLLSLVELRSEPRDPAGPELQMAWLSNPSADYPVAGAYCKLQNLESSGSGLLV